MNSNTKSYDAIVIGTGLTGSWATKELSESGMKVAALDAANVFALPSRQEGIGGVYIEAWALKKPVISCKIPFLTIRDGIDGVMVQQDADLLADKLSWFLDHPEEAEKMGQAGFERVQDEYSWELIVSKVEGFFKELIKRKY